MNSVNNFGVVRTRPCRYTNNGEVSLTVNDPHVTNDCDINYLYRNFVQYGTFYPSRLARATAQPHFGDFTETDFVKSMQYIAEARERFEALPVEIRQRFGYNPRNLLAFLSDKNNVEEAKKLGLMEEIKKPVGLDDVVTAVNNLKKDNGGNGN